MLLAPSSLEFVDAWLGLMQLGLSVLLIAYARPSQSRWKDRTNSQLNPIARSASLLRSLIFAKSVE